MTMRKRCAAIGLGMALVLGGGVAGLVAQEPGQVPPKGSPARRVPPYFGQVGLTPQQREQIYLIRAKYADRLAQLKQQMEALQSQEMAECEAVLNEQQRAALAQKRAGSNRGRSSGASTEAKTAPKPAADGN
jgi:hypothetical protein